MFYQNMYLNDEMMNWHNLPLWHFLWYKLDIKRITSRECRLSKMHISGPSFRRRSFSRAQRIYPPSPPIYLLQIHNREIITFSCLGSVHIVHFLDITVLSWNVFFPEIWYMWMLFFTEKEILLNFFQLWEVSSTGISFCITSVQIFWNHVDRDVRFVFNLLNQFYPIWSCTTVCKKAKISLLFHLPFVIYLKSCKYRLSKHVYSSVWAPAVATDSTTLLMPETLHVEHVCMYNHTAISCV